MPFRAPSLRHKRHSDCDDSDELLVPRPAAVGAPELNDSLTPHMALLRRRAQSSGRWHLIAIFTAAMLALVMAGFFSR